MASVVSTNSTNSRFHDRTVFITGAARGMGRAHALAFAREGARLVVCDACRQYNTVPYALTQPEELASLASEIEQMGRPVLAEQVDVTNLAAMSALAERAQRELGPINILVANAVPYSFSPTLTLPKQPSHQTSNITPHTPWIR